MKRLHFAALSALALALAGCVVVPVARDDGPPPPPPPPPPPRVVNVPPPPPPRVVEVPPPEPAPVVWYHGPHFIPESEGGGWCYEEGAHTHDYFPDRPDVYVVDRGYYTYDGPAIFVYVGGHPLPGGGWCFIEGPHQHEYYPPPHAGFAWRHGHGFFYEGPYRPARPPPPAFWPHPARWHRVPPPAQLPSRQAPVYRPPRGATPSAPPRVVPAPAPERTGDHDRGRFEDRDRRDDRGRVDDHDRRIERGHLDEDPAPPTKPRFEQRFDHRKDEQPKGATNAAPGPKDRLERAPARRPVETVDRRKDDGKAATDKVKPDKDDAKDDAGGRPGRGRH